MIENLIKKLKEEYGEEVQFQGIYALFTIDSEEGSMIRLVKLRCFNDSNEKRN